MQMKEILKYIPLIIIHFNLSLNLCFADTPNPIFKGSVDIVKPSIHNIQNDTTKTTGDKSEISSLSPFLLSKILILIFIYTIVLVSVFIYFINRQKQRHKDQLSFQLLDLDRQKKMINAQHDEWQIQKNLVIHQRDKIINMLTDLGESIDYARKIQQAILPPDNYLKKLLGDYFLVFHPRESVGGDFYWSTQHEKLICFAVGDCTGHGIPGGFMSMLSISLLNESLNSVADFTPSSVLGSLREKMIKALNQTGLDEDSQDGMDISLCIYNPDTNILSYSGANLPIFISTHAIPEKNERIAIQDNIIELKPDRMPISFYQRMNNFTELSIKLNPGDTIYLFSDGFVDQFGGEKNKKFGYIAFRNLIHSVSNLPVEKQPDSIWSTFEHWKGLENQTDDVIVFGIKL